MREGSKVPNVFSRYSEKALSFSARVNIMTMPIMEAKAKNPSSTIAVVVMFIMYNI